ncbi:putative metal-binding protein [Desulfitobacterium sp. LBE]|uniref:Metal-binding protein n=3 Tax=root TaxID=1 RepID=A0A098B7I8_DESHA|nr:MULTISPECIES: DUF2284 domain-containing protein [Desulfitobacterium]EHL04866.1 hypothetical protein HMPREF0322_04439 [Desulfitobacterium hafniense DP7]KTE93728.1 metal-binding protein [Desulfitobacterium hafniense]MEA5022174.1 DUF2284 domain-containing protein [Desulfitobacterium hafniense]TWH59506.1 putative metal-binding protein [Desulfitobacterium sp. LBE]CDX04828.1 Predicted metal-binding protein (DUF2284) [Desulfitobacterium hafniense]
MNPEITKMLGYLETLGVNHSAHIDTRDIPFNPDFRKQCEQNVCGNYQKNWMCPPNVGDFAELKEKALQYKQAILFQTVHQLEDSFDFEGMQEGMAEQNRILRTFLGWIGENNLITDFLSLGIGPCPVCSRCSILDGQECRLPEQAVASVEAYGIDVTSLVKHCGIPYNNGVNTVSYVSLVLF